jgi:UDP-N-acetylmuramate--alanine ligase
MNFKDIKYAYFLGIGGIGMSAIARYFSTTGIKVMGYDKTETDLTKELVKEGIAVHYDDNVDLLRQYELSIFDTLVVLTPAIPKDHQEWAYLREEGFTIMKRSQVLGVITDAYKTISVAGTHGKTTTSTLIAHILKQSHLDCAAFLGGISTNYTSNLLLHKKNKQNTMEQLMVVEADEFDRSFLTLHPSISIVTSTDADHLDIYGEHASLKKSFLEYAHQTRKNGTLIVKKDLDIIPDLKVPYFTYSIKEKADIYADNIRITGDQYFFDLHIGDRKLEKLVLGIPGLHNVENAVAASAATIQAGVTDEELRTALASFSGVKRRFEYIIKSNDMVYIDDYAHHPEELRAIISSVKAMYKNKKITVIFQPHLYTRTRDFVEGFAESLSLADDVLLLDIYPARELPIEGVSSEMIYNKMAAHKMLCSKKDVLDIISRKKPEVLLTLGAGDIDQLIEPIRKLLMEIKKVA